jgi:protein-disulfide isomerase
MDHLLEKYSGKIKLEVYHMPWSNQSKQAAEASLCAEEQGKFWEYHEILFHYQKQWASSAQPEKSFIQYAKLFELNEGKFNSCLNSGKMGNKVGQDKSYGKSLSINLTPTVFINNVRVVGSKPAYVYEQIIEQELKQKG